MPPLSIAIFAGPSGGHLFPAVAFSEALRSRHPAVRIHLVTSLRARRFAASLAPGLFEEVIYLPEFPFPAGLSLRTARFLLQLPQVFLSSFRHLSRIRPDLSVGFGSYVSYPGMLLSVWRGIPTLIHEQNVLPGRATRALASHVRCVAVTFPETFAGRGPMAPARPPAGEAGSPGRDGQCFAVRREVTGLPIRAALGGAVKHTFSAAGSFRVLVLGGSQGSGGLNRFVTACFCRFSREELRELAVTHITGARDAEEVRRVYEELGVSHEIHPFYQDMATLYRHSDLAVTRAGTSTLFELALFGVPAIVVPYPHAGAHQAENAAAFGNRQAVIVRQEDQLDAEWLAAELRALRADPGRRKALSEAVGALAVHGAADRLVDLALGLLDERQLRDLRGKLVSRN